MHPTSSYICRDFVGIRRGVARHNTARIRPRRIGMLYNNNNKAEKSDKYDEV